MKKEEEAKRRISTIMGSLHGFNNILIAKSDGFDLSKIDPLYSALEKEVSKQGRNVIEISQIPEKPREANIILRDIADKGKVTPELLDEIKRKFAQPAAANKPKNP